MKKLMIMIVIVVATLAIVSCAKDNISKTQLGEPVTFSFESPAALEQESSDTKVVLRNDPGTSGTTKPLYNWATGDKINIFSYSLPSDDWTSSKITDWGTFTAKTIQTLSAGQNRANFTGYIPDSPETDAYLILHSQSNSSYTVSRNNVAGRYDIKCNIPAIQDGTGLRYSIFGARPVYNAETKVFSFTDITSLATNNSSSTAWNNQFGLRSALSCFSIPADKHITKIEITVSRSDGAAGQYLASKDDKQDITINSLGFFFSGGGSSTITIYKDGADLPTDIYFASRQAEGSAGNYYPILTFVFTNASGQTATKTLKLAINNGATKNDLRNLSSGYLNKLGSVTFGANDFQ